MTTTASASTTTMHAESHQSKSSSDVSASTSPSGTAVCGARTRSGTACQNTLVTGCGRCPVHAAHLRAAHNGFKQRNKSRRKKSLSQTGYSPAALSLDHFMLSNFSRMMMDQQQQQQTIRPNTPPPTITSTRMQSQSLDSLPLVYEHVDQPQSLPDIISPQQPIPSPRGFQTPLLQNIHQSPILSGGDMSEYAPVFKDDEIAIGTPVTPNPDLDDNVHHLYCPDQVTDNLHADVGIEPSHLQSPHRLNYTGEFNAFLSPKYVVPFEQSLD